ncbi:MULTISPECIES: hypothetical protein [Leptolyngbya]|uniref:hypothetical protein n=1 Tax=Leptolyngbya TaxID=47251 RepID=UPI001181ADAB|nr:MULTISPECIES: hypothetical protein [Leptolyngbya]MBD2371345.1 hypothetical protein [Leptolyngbya sp. FACHB-161]MBD2377839.1 hypothetical protein [Leptolyngbya sp. FACHB-238]MBD2402276.1 hypothetical protein [Leptolyngbya sp. FACHB-239]MBD2408769.1 hypothetical protein [Leptolyngbya sp. FACHB-402]ULP33826.1 hypothetical protein MCP04_32145 [Leptolyngbya boryana IU 594]
MLATSTQWLVQNGWAVSFPDYKANKLRKPHSGASRYHSSLHPKIGVSRIAKIVPPWTIRDRINNGASASYARSPF